MPLATTTMIPRLSRLWTACFGDSKAYTAYIFENLITPGHCVAREDHDTVSCMLFFEPFTLKGGGQPFKGAYIYGVATDPAYRGRGLSTHLLEEAHTLLQSAGYSLSVLVPASESLFDFYAQRGYVPFSDICRISPDDRDNEIAPRDVALTQARLQDLYDDRERFFSSSCAYVSWPPSYLEYTGKECAHFGGEVLRVIAGREEGYAVCYVSPDAVYIKEMMLSYALFDTAAASIRKRYGERRCIFNMPADFGAQYDRPVLPYSMVKWYDKSGCIRRTEAETPPYIAFTLD
ncbi:MAG: GNAT family N-acetyltransferase [Oscillospiraceae bacterium]|jgi:GNAT superfamily N-acetyltransferase|nr:GNAT family N-acetyltransferase [Oscillospiraceae bacterium]